MAHLSPPPLKGVIYGCKIFPVPSNFQQTLWSESPLPVKDLAHSQDLRFGYLLAAINCYIKPLEKKKKNPVLYLETYAIKGHLDQWETSL